jgi:hypothetical protein
VHSTGNKILKGALYGKQNEERCGLKETRGTEKETKCGLKEIKQRPQTELQMDQKDDKKKKNTQVQIIEMEGGRIVRKNNQDIGLKVKSGRLSLLARKISVALVWYAQDLRDQEDQDGRWCIPVAGLMRDVKFNSHAYELFRQAMSELQSVKLSRKHESGGMTSEVLIPSFTLDNIGHDGNESKAIGQKKRGGELMLWFMLPPLLKNQILDPIQYSKLPLQYLVSFKTIQAFELYQICRRYMTNPGHLTHREPWQNWWFIMTGEEGGAEIPEYKYAKRNIFNDAVNEINQISDIEIELIEHKIGRSTGDIQFKVFQKQQTHLHMAPQPIDANLMIRMTRLGVHNTEIERFVMKYSPEEILAAVEMTESRISKTKLEPIESPGAYFSSALTANWAKAKKAEDLAKAKDTADKKEKLKTKTEAEEEGRAAKAKRYKEVEDAFERASLDEQERLLFNFVATLAPSNQLKYKKQGLKALGMRSSLIVWLAELGLS